MCDEDYRGASPFSEVETQAIKNFVERHNNFIKIAFNFHAFGNLLIHPFNYDGYSNEDLTNNFNDFYNIYRKIMNFNELPKNIKVGNGRNTIGYSADGEASDWMLAEHNILSMSPELGTNSKESETFFINKTEELKTVVFTNYPWVFKTMSLIFPQIEVSLIEGLVLESKNMNSVVRIELLVCNEGLSSYSGKKLIVVLNS